MGKYWLALTSRDKLTPYVVFFFVVFFVCVCILQFILSIIVQTGVSAGYHTITLEKTRTSVSEFFSGKLHLIKEKNEVLVLKILKKKPKTQN